MSMFFIALVSRAPEQGDEAIRSVQAIYIVDAANADAAISTIRGITVTADDVIALPVPNKVRL